MFAASAAAVPVDWTQSFLLRGASTGGLENPLLRVAFNPQPEPPAAGTLGFVDPTMASYPPDPIITHTGASAGDAFRLLFGIVGASPLVLGDGAFIDPQRFELELLGGDIALLQQYRVVFDLSTSSGGSPIDWVAFNPQPEPPALGAGAAAFGADFSFDSFSDASLRLQLFDAHGVPIALQVIPEPAGALLVLAGVLAATGGRRRSVRQRRSYSPR